MKHAGRRLVSRKYCAFVFSLAAWQQTATLYRHVCVKASRAAGLMQPAGSWEGRELEMGLGWDIATCNCPTDIIKSALLEIKRVWDCQHWICQSQVEIAWRPAIPICMEQKIVGGNLPAADFQFTSLCQTPQWKQVAVWTFCHRLHLTSSGCNVWQPSPLKRQPWQLILAHYLIILCAVVSQCKESKENA